LNCKGLLKHKHTLGGMVLRDRLTLDACAVVPALFPIRQGRSLHHLTGAYQKIAWETLIHDNAAPLRRGIHSCDDYAENSIFQPYFA
jgi:hypothetical protein